MDKVFQNPECCPKFDPTPWEDKLLSWDKKKFIKEKVATCFYTPLNFGSVMKRVMKKIEESGATVEDWIVLSDHTSKWNMDLYIAVDREIKDAQNLTLSGTFLSKVYEGDFKQTGAWCKDYEKAANAKGLKIKKWYMWYTTCPKCAKKYGKNYVVILSEV